MSSPDVIATVLQDLEPELSVLFGDWHPATEAFIKNGGIEGSINGRYKEFTVVTGGPGRPVKIMNGSERIPAIRAQNRTKGDQFATRIIYPFDIPALDLAEAGTSKTGLRNLVKQYPEEALIDLHELLVGQLMRGSGSSGAVANAADLDGVLTFNGDQDYNPAGSARDGVFQALAAGAQTNTVFNLPLSGAASNPTTGWEHQFGQITTMGSDGLPVLRETRDTAERKGGKTSGGIDLMLGDPASYQNYVNTLDTFYESNAVVKDDHVNENIRDGVMFGKAKFFAEDAIDLSDTTSFTSAAMQSGVIYGLRTGDWSLFKMGKDDKMETKGWFSFRGPTRVPDLDGWRWEIILHFNFFCRQLRTQFLVCGGATA